MRIFISVFFVACAFFAYSQTIVSTSPADKNVVIEEFTGIHCGYCPDGHKIAQQIVDADSGRVWAVNIHTGSYATPGAGEPDYRTPWGTAIAGQTGLTGYPAGSVNRHVFTSPSPMSTGGTAHSRSNWATCSGIIMNEASPVNVAVDADIDYLTGILTVLVEVYYTSSSAVSTNYLNLAILQNNVKGPQSGSSANPTQVTSDGQYWHMHMLRELITGQWGFAINTTTTGTFWDSTFVITLPADYYGINVEVPNIEVLAFVTESQQEILTAHGVHLPLPTVDAGAIAIDDVPAYTCTGIFTPTVTIKNFAADSLTSVDIIYYIEGEASATYNWTGALATGAEVDVILPQITAATAGSNTFIVKTDNPNTSVDMNTVNDSTMFDFAVFSTSTAAPKTEAFTSTTFPPSGLVIVDADVDGKLWTRSSQGHNAGGSAFINWYSISSGKKDDIFISPLDFTGMTDMAMTFYVAYRQYSSENDRLQVDISTDCGLTWINKWIKSGNTLETGSSMTGSFSVPTASEWRLEVVDLSAYDNTDDVMIRFRATSNYGNNLFLDDINIDAGASIFEDDVVTVINLYPNPAIDATVLRIDAAQSANAQITIINTLGEFVYSSSTYVNNGRNDINLNTATLQNGIYIVRVSIADEMYNIRLSITK